VVVLAVLGGAAFWGYTAWNEAGAETQRVRWGSVSIELPVASSADDLRAVQEWYSHGTYSPRYLPAPRASMPVLRLSKGEGLNASWLVIDAYIGEVLFDQVQPEDRAAFDAALATVRVEDEERPWPYGTTLPATPRRGFGNITYVQPNPASGIGVLEVYNDFTPVGSVRSLQVSSAMSSTDINAETGEVIRVSVDERDREAFDRFTSEIRVGGQVW
jgi:hypothetical protein